MVLKKVIPKEVQTANFKFVDKVVTIHFDGAKEYERLAKNVDKKCQTNFLASIYARAQCCCRAC